ncbi:hypothetical protein HNR77_002219 [Paenibacillus sp. JGP012]|uniref:hypothetical protein n=1 Tax=Paenibacillus sp. JGP012 TaxID=2735914 RepID=UPI001621FF00|nr:hypothetical protein [Paenibacillus sp. JGP012]MBB6021126.1 hypothetical protein [Paenibacillus sp. JGP012]
MKKILISLFCISSSIGFGYVYSSSLHTHDVHNHLGATIQSDSIAEELSIPELIVKGIVIEELPEVRRETGIYNPKVDTSYLVTPVKVKVEEVISGNLIENEIIYLQRKESTDKLKTNNEVVLMLNRTSDNFYWSYNFNDGVWQVDNGIVSSSTESKMLKGFKNTDATEFVEEIKEELNNSME